MQRSFNTFQVCRSFLALVQVRPVILTTNRYQTKLPPNPFIKTKMELKLHVGPVDTNSGFLHADRWPKGSDSHQSSYSWAWLRSAVYGIENKKLKNLGQVAFHHSKFTKKEEEKKFPQVSTDLL